MFASATTIGTCSLSDSDLLNLPDIQQMCWLLFLNAFVKSMLFHIESVSRISKMPNNVQSFSAMIHHEF